MIIPILEQVKVYNVQYRKERESYLNNQYVDSIDNSEEMVALVAEHTVSLLCKGTNRNRDTHLNIKTLRIPEPIRQMSENLVE